MTAGNLTGNTKTFAISLTGIKPGASLEDLVTTLQRLYPRKTAEQLRAALGRLPLLLTRGATEEQARKLKHFLESKGAILKFAHSLQDTQPAGQPEIGRSPAAAPPPPRTAEPRTSITPQVERPYTGVERRAKPRVHSGIEIHPMGIGEILDRSFRLLRQHFLTFFLILMIPQATFFLISKGTETFAGVGVKQGMAMNMAIGIIISAILAVLFMITLQFWAQGALIYAVSETYLGHSTSVGASYGAMRSRLGRLIGTMFLMGLLLGLMLVVLSLLGGLLVGEISSGASWLKVAGTVIIGLGLTVQFFNLLLNWLLVDKVVVLEGTAWRSALRRSKELMNTRTEDGFWKRPKNKGGLILLLGFLIGIGIHLLFQVPGLITQWIAPTSLMGPTLQAIFNLVATSLATVFTAIAMILFYYDIRLRSEGFDLKMMAEHL